MDTIPKYTCTIAFLLTKAVPRSNAQCMTSPCPVRDRIVDVNKGTDAATLESPRVPVVRYLSHASLAQR